MEDKSIDAAAATKVVPTVPPTATNGKKTPTEGAKARNKRGGFTFIKAAMFMVRRGPSGKSKPPVASNDKLMKLVGSMRPLHLQDNQSPPPSIGKQSEEMISTPLSSDSSPDRPSSSSCSVDSLSQYGSATNLQALDKGGVMRSYASSPNLQGLVEVDKGSESSENRYASSTNLQRSSRYASAKDLLELELKGDDSGDDDDENDEDSDNNNGGDEMIDAKADEFIAKFYNQMKLQHMHSF